jgi:glycosyltransferase involved in cell wall biosynthesis
MYSLIIPVYKNEESLVALIEALEWIRLQLDGSLEVVFVIDGSPDQSYLKLKKLLPSTNFKFQLARLSKNFGSFSAIRAGLSIATGNFYSVMAADLQEPKELAVTFFKEIEKNEFDIIIGTRESRNDPFFTKLSSSIFWLIYKKFVQPEMPKGGVDMFACNQAFKKELLQLCESNSSLIGLIFWLGFRRKIIFYSRHERLYGKSAWTFKKKLKYMMDSIFSFSDLPIKILLNMGFLGLGISLMFSFFVIVSKVFGFITVPGYTATVLLIIFFGSLNSFGLGIIGNYIWRAFENTKQRPESVILSIEKGEP